MPLFGTKAKWKQRGRYRILNSLFGYPESFSRKSLPESLTDGGFYSTFLVSEIPRGVTVAQQILTLFVEVQILAGELTDGNGK